MLCSNEEEEAIVPRSGIVVKKKNISHVNSWQRMWSKKDQMPHKKTRKSLEVTLLTSIARSASKSGSGEWYSSRANFHLVNGNEWNGSRAKSNRWKRGRKKTSILKLDTADELSWKSIFEYTNIFSLLPTHRHTLRSNVDRMVFVEEEEREILPLKFFHPGSIPSPNYFFSLSPHAVSFLSRRWKLWKREREREGKGNGRLTICKSFLDGKWCLLHRSPSFPSSCYA